ncbi:MAG: hypothetical protein LBF74_07320 [Treponema sp.]|jgi:hypothetical protein|nr:hypothetical protein [Treponema sp.]
MKTVNRLFLSGVLAALLAGCFSPITAVPPQPQDGGPAPFTVDVLIGGGGARSIAGPDAVPAEPILMAAAGAARAIFLRNPLLSRLRLTA